MNRNKKKTRRIMTEEHKKKIGDANRGHRHTEEAKRRIGDASKGNKYSLGYKHTQDAIERIIKARTGKHMLHTTKKKIGDGSRGEKNHNWKGGTSPINEVIRKSSEYKLWRTAVFERDSYACIWCGVKNGNGKSVILNADHIKPFALFPELRFAIDNGRTLCIQCHRTTDTWGGNTKFKKLIKENEND